MALDEYSPRINKVQFISKIILSLIYSNVFISLGAAFSYFALGALLEKETNFSMVIFNFGITFSYYNLCQCIGIKGLEFQNMSPLQKFVAKNMTEILFFNFFLLVFCLYCFFSFQLYAQYLFIILLSFIAFFYLYYNDIIHKTRILKPLIIATAWALLPFFTLQINLCDIDLNYFSMITLYIFLLSIVYDQKDRDPNSFIHAFGNTISRAVVIVLHLIIIALFINKVHDYSIWGIGLFFLVSNCVLLYGIHKKEELWHLTFTDGLIHFSSLLLILNSK